MKSTIIFSSVTFVSYAHHVSCIVTIRRITIIEAIDTVHSAGVRVVSAGNISIEESRSRSFSSLEEDRRRYPPKKTWHRGRRGLSGFLFQILRGVQPSSVFLEVSTYFRNDRHSRHLWLTWIFYSRLLSWYVSHVSGNDSHHSHTHAWGFLLSNEYVGIRIRVY